MCEVNILTPLKSTIKRQKKDTSRVKFVIWPANGCFLLLIENKTYSVKIKFQAQIKWSAKDSFRCL